MEVPIRTIKMWAEEDRPREKLEIKGKETLTNAEILAIIIGSGTRSKTAVQLAQEILIKTDNNLYKLGKLNQWELMQFPGIGKAKALNIIAALELGKRRNTSVIPRPQKIDLPKDAYNYIKPFFQDLSHEEFRIIGLATNNRVIKEELISKGGISGTVADGKIIFKKLLDMKATGVILVHNHPSGKLKPSKPDLSLTKRFVKFGEMIDIRVLDHLIISDLGYFSLQEEGML